MLKYYYHSDTKKLSCNDKWRHFFAIQVHNCIMQRCCICILVVLSSAISSLMFTAMAHIPEVHHRCEGNNWKWLNRLIPHYLHSIPFELSIQLCTLSGCFELFSKAHWWIISCWNNSIYFNFFLHFICIEQFLSTFSRSSYINAKFWFNTI